MSLTTSGGDPLTSGSKHRIRLNLSLGSCGVNCMDSQQEKLSRKSTSLMIDIDCTDTPFLCKAPIREEGVGR